MPQQAEKDQKWAAFGDEVRGSFAGFFRQLQRPEAEPAAQVEWDAFGNQPAGHPDILRPHFNSCLIIFFSIYLFW